MKKNVFAICDLETEYAVNFMEYLNRRKSLPFEIQAFTSVETLTAYAEKNPVEILLISDRAMCREVQALKIGTVVILSEERPDPARKGFPAVYKYQAQDQLLREVMACYGEAPDLTPLVSLAARRNTEILGVYSPLHRCLKTSIALTLGQILAQDKAVLYLNLEEYSGFEGLMEKTYDSDLADLIYYARQEDADLTKKMSAMIRTVGGLDYIPPVRTPWDLRCLTLRDCRRILDSLVRCSAYEVILLDLGTEMEDILELLKLCSRIYMPVLTDPVSACKMRQFEQMVSAWDCEELWEKTVRLRPPYYASAGWGGSYVEQLAWGELASYLRKALKLKPTA